MVKEVILKHRVVIAQHRGAIEDTFCGGTENWFIEQLKEVPNGSK
jgi:hypothetical protein